MIERVLTIGAYGFTGETLLAALRGAGVDLFVDVRARRGVRGAEYSFVNARRLQAALRDANIRYAHVPALAPSKTVREAQYAIDGTTGTAKRKRTRLSDEFVAAYARECLDGWDAVAFAAEVLTMSHRPAFFCVERTPAACHRALVAERLAAALAVPIQHLEP